MKVFAKNNLINANSILLKKIYKITIIEYDTNSRDKLIWLFICVIKII